MKFTNTKAYTNRLLVGLVIAAASLAGLNGVAEASTCATCHAPQNQTTPDYRPVENSSVFRNITTGAIKGSHAKHIPTATTDANKCAPCHGTASASYGVKHRDGFVNVTTNTTKSLTYSKSSKFAQSGTSAPVTLGTCSTAYCHSSGQATPVYVQTPAWGVAGGATCAECHGNAASLATGQHNKHVGTLATVGRSVACADCHSATATGSTAIANFANHANSSVNIKYDNVINKDTDASTYNSVATTTANGAVSTASATGYTCANLYCHSSGNVNNAGTAVAPTTFKSIAWNAAAIGCDGCHGDGAGKAHPTYASGAVASATANSHVKHVESSSLSCDYCHNTTTTNTTIPPTTVTTTGVHLNRTDDVSFKSNGGKTGTYAAAGKTCSATYCHGTGPSTGWGGTTTCSSCHDATASTLATGHAKHAPATAPSVLAGGTDAHTTSTYGFSCLACHPSNQHSTGQASSTAPVQDAAVTGSKITAYAKGAASITDAKGFNYTTTGTCTTVCHTKDGATAGSAITASPAWNGTNALGCGMCHNKPADASPTWSAAHTKHINTYSANTNITCTACHNGTAASNTALQATVQARTQHPDATIQVEMDTFATGGTVAIAGTTRLNRSCTNTYCHSNGTLVAGTHAAVAWNATAYSTCAECHGNKASISTGSHSQHVNLAGVTCASCHNSTASNDTTISNYANHVNKNVTINFNSAGSASATYAGTAAGGSNVFQKGVATTVGGCAATDCHGSSSPNWGGNTANNSCTKCHGTGSASVTPATRYLVAPTGTSSDTGQVSTGKIGAHQTHLRYFNGLSEQGTDAEARCIVCHGPLPASSNHASTTTSDPTSTFQGLAKGTGTYAVSYNSGTGSCSVYCHNPAAATGGTLAATNAGTGTAPLWADATYINYDGTPPTFKTQVNCDKCHLSPNGSRVISSKSNHSALTIASDCVGCHKHDGGTGGGTGVGEKHMDGALFGAGNCDSCHGYGASTWASATPINAGGIGAHATHITYLTTKRASIALTPASDTYAGATAAWTGVCGICHGNTPSDHKANGVNVTLNQTYLFGTSGTALYNGAPGGAVANKTCSNLSCHYFTSPQWSN